MLFTLTFGQKIYRFGKTQRSNFFPGSTLSDIHLWNGSKWPVILWWCKNSLLAYPQNYCYVSLCMRPLTYIKSLILFLNWLFYSYKGRTITLSNCFFPHYDERAKFQWLTLCISLIRRIDRHTNIKISRQSFCTVQLLLISNEIFEYHSVFSSMFPILLNLDPPQVW